MNTSTKPAQSVVFITFSRIKEALFEAIPPFDAMPVVDV
jgi:hypothetical protein